jgi:hypothetical protein
MHPEVSRINLLKKDKNKNYIFRDTVSMKTSGNKYLFNNIYTQVHKRPLTDKDLGFYLAGLLEGDGWFSKKGNIFISFYELDAPLAYWLKERIGYGIVRKFPNKRSIVLEFNKFEAKLIIAKLINGKLRTDKIETFNNNILINLNSRLQEPLPILSKDLSPLKESYWLAGFSDADASFQIKIISRSNRLTGYEIRINFQVDQKTDYILNQIKDTFGGNIGHRKSQDTYYYNSDSISSIKKIISYFENYHLMSNKYLNYFEWRRVYYMIKEDKHLTLEGVEKIKAIKNSMNSYSDKKFEFENIEKSAETSDKESEN